MTHTHICLRLSVALYMYAHAWAQMAVQAGISYDDMHLPLLLSAAYGARPPKMIVLLRDPVERWGQICQVVHTRDDGLGIQQHVPSPSWAWVVPLCFTPTDSMHAHT